jgi:hypothetical protein
MSKPACVVEVMVLVGCVRAGRVGIDRVEHDRSNRGERRYGRPQIVRKIKTKS